MTPAIAILGAGPSGLALGRLLELANIDYIIFERDNSEIWSIGRGGTLDLHVGSGQLTLQEAGLWDEFLSFARYEATTRFADMNGEVLFRFGEEGECERPEIDRKDLRAMLLKSIPEGKVQWGKRVQEVRREDNGSSSVYFTDGSIASGFRLIVGADGAWSKARSRVTSASPLYSGITFLATLIKPGNPTFPSVTSLAGQGNYCAFGEQKQIAAQRLGDGSYYIAIGFHMPEDWSSNNAALLNNPTELRKHLVEKYFATWPKIHTDLIEHSDGDFRPWPLWYMPTESLSWQSVPGVTLIGDAAHVTTPFQGEGVNCALHDSLQLAQQITKFGLDNLDKAVVEYERLMFPRGIDLITRSNDSGELLFHPDSPQSFLQAAFSDGLKYETSREA